MASEYAYISPTGLKKIDFIQLLGMLKNAEEVRIKKQKISAQGIITPDKNQWVVKSIVWEFLKNSNEADIQSPDNVISKVDTARLNIQTLNKDETADEYLTESFDLQSADGLKFYYDTAKNQVLADIQQNTGVLVDTYRYYFEFYGSQSISQKDLLKATGGGADCDCKINKIIAL